MSSFRLDKKRILLTGAAGRFGRATLAELLEAGAEVILVGRSLERLEETMEAFGGQARALCHPYECDIADSAARSGLIDWLHQRFDALHGIVNNAYAGRVGKLETIGEADFADAAEMNLVAPFELVKSCLDLLQASATQTGHSASVVNVASMYGLVSPDPSVYGDSGKNNPVHYGATKAGMIQMTRYLACHLGQRNVRINSVSPGPFPDLTIDPGIPGFYDKLASKVPLGRVGSPREVAGPIVFLLSEASSYVNGADLRIDGGWTAW